MLVDAYEDKIKRGEKVPFYDSEDKTQRRQIGEVIAVWREDHNVKAKVWLLNGNKLELKIADDE